MKRNDILFLRGCKGIKGSFVEGSKNQIKAAGFQAQGLLELRWAGAPMPSMSFPGELRRPMIYTLTTKGEETARARLPAKGKS